MRAVGVPGLSNQTDHLARSHFIPDLHIYLFIMSESLAYRPTVWHAVFDFD
jgi:hypothetical protein